MKNFTLYFFKISNTCIFNWKIQNALKKKNSLFLPIISLFVAQVLDLQKNVISFYTSQTLSNFSLWLLLLQSKISRTNIHFSWTSKIVSNKNKASMRRKKIHLKKNSLALTTYMSTFKDFKNCWHIWVKQHLKLQEKNINAFYQKFLLYFLSYIWVFNSSLRVNMWNLRTPSLLLHLS